MTYEVNMEHLSITAVAAILYALNREYGMDCSRHVAEVSRQFWDGGGAADGDCVEIVHDYSRTFCRCIED